MKKQTQYLVVMLAVLALAGGLYGGLLWWNSGAEEREAAQAVYVTQVSGLTGLTIIPTKGEALTFTKADGSWSWSEDGDFPVEQAAVTAVTDLLAALKAERVIEIPDSLADYGLEEPAWVLSGTDGEGAAFRLSIGNKSSSGAYYASLDGDPAVYTVDSGLVTAVDFELLDVCELETLPVMSASTVERVTIGDNTLEKVVTTRGVETERDTGEVDEDGNPIYETVTTEEETTAWYLNGVEVTAGSYMANLTALEFQQCVAFKPENLSVFHLDGENRTVITVELEEETVTLWIGRSGDGSYAMLPDGNLVYAVDDEVAAGVMDLTQLPAADQNTEIEE